MKKILITLASLFFLVLAAWIFLQPAPATHHPFATMRGSLESIVSPSGFQLTEQRTTFASVRSSRFKTLGRLYEQIADRPPYNDEDAFTFTNGTETILVTVYHHLGKLVSVEIRSNLKPSAAAESLKAGLDKKYPDLNCRVKQS